MVSNLEYYKTFYYVAKTGSLTQAASLLSISQPAVSQALKQLEQQTKAKLFRRVSKGVKLTAEGELLYSYVAKGYEQFLLGEERLKQMQNSELGEIHIGASDMTLQFFLLPYLEQFHEKYPGIKVIVSNAPTPETIENLKKNRLISVLSVPHWRRTLPYVPSPSGKSKISSYAAGALFPIKPDAGLVRSGNTAPYLSRRQYQLQALYGRFSFQKQRFPQAGIRACHQ